MTVRVRIAPSPTGNLHIGTARTALFNWLFARRHGGQFILRIEDTDLERSDKKYEKSIIEGLKWLDIQWDGEIFRQSERLKIYAECLQVLLDSGKAFWCHHSIGELEAEKNEQMSRKEPPRHICGHKNTEKGKEKGEIIRLAVNHESSRAIEFEDAVRGKINWKENSMSDISLAKDMQTPLYNFAVVADDIEMGITHVIRGEDHISNTPRQILIYEALGKELPVFAHLPLILGPDKSKLSKRHGATSIIDYQKDYLPEALVNFMGFLGYTYSREILSKEEMADEFDLAKIHKSGAVFNVEKLNWINAQYVKKLGADAFRKLIGRDVPDRAVPLMTERLEKLSDAGEFDYFWQDPDYERDLLVWKDALPEDVKKALESVREILSSIDFSSSDDVREALDGLGRKIGNRGLAYWPLRVALTGKKASPDPVDIALILGRDKSLERIDSALRKLQN
ncbi:MAG: glutamate--tRNA ligase [Candidatus Yanofskybacteria bacterium]|nr:glutamate--tRNA ligase [Candidatus Yanofskybacteria bacterium]